MYICFVTQLELTSHWQNDRSRVNSTFEQFLQNLNERITQIPVVQVSSFLGNYQKMLNYQFLYATFEYRDIRHFQSLYVRTAMRGALLHSNLRTRPRNVINTEIC